MKMVSPQLSTQYPLLAKCFLVLGLFTLFIYYFQDEIILQSIGIAMMLKSNDTLFGGNARSINQQTMFYCDLFNPKVVRCGEPFNDSWIPVLKRLNLSDEQISKMTPDDDKRILSKFPTFVTAFSDNHYAVARKWVIPQIRELAPNNTWIIIYDLGLNSRNLGELRKLSFIELRNFNFSMYPAYFRDLFQFRWKPLLIAETLRQHEAVFYADAHFHWKHEMNLSNLLQKVQCKPDAQCNYSNAVFLSGSKHSIFVATHKRMYDFLPMDQDAAKRTEMGHAGLQLIYNTKDVRANVMKWFVLCALEQECMAPKGSVIACYFHGDSWNTYANCHRQDQAAMSIVLANRNRLEGALRGSTTMGKQNNGSKFRRFIIDFGETRND